MKRTGESGYRFPPEIIQQAIWLYLRFTLSLRDVEDWLAERGVAVSYETVRPWGRPVPPNTAIRITPRKPGRGGDTRQNGSQKKLRRGSPGIIF